MTLHIIQKNPFSHNALVNCLKVASKNDALLLMNDGIYACQHELLKDTNLNVFALTDDLAARGITPPAAIKSIEYTEFVSLCTEYDKSISWF